MPVPQFSPLLHLVLITLTAHIALVAARITTSLYAISLHASNFTIGVLIALFSLFPMLLAVPMGRWVDRTGIALPASIGISLMGLGCLAPSLFDGLPVLYCSVLLIGSGFLAVHIAIQHTVGTMTASESRARNFNWLALGYSTSSFVGPVLAGYVIEHIGHSTAYALACSFAVLSGLLFIFLPLKQFDRQNDPHSAAPTDQQTQHTGILALLRERELRRVYLVSICLASAWDLFMFVMPIHCSEIGLSASSIGLILGCFSAATFVVRLAMPWISNHYSEWQVLTGALFIATLCYLIFPFTNTTISIVSLTFVLGLALGSSQPNVLALLHNSAPPGRAAEAFGVRVTIGNATQVALPLAFGAAGATVGLFPVFWTMAALIGIGIPLAWRKAVRR